MARVSRMTLGAGSDNVVCSWGQARLTPFIQKEADVRMGWGPWLGFRLLGRAVRFPRCWGFAAAWGLGAVQAGPRQASVCRSLILVRGPQTGVW